MATMVSVATIVSIAVVVSMAAICCMTMYLRNMYATVVTATKDSMDSIVFFYLIN